MAAQAADFRLASRLVYRDQPVGPCAAALVVTRDRHDRIDHVFFDLSLVEHEARCNWVEFDGFALEGIRVDGPAEQCLFLSRHLLELNSHTSSFQLREKPPSGVKVTVKRSNAASTSLNTTSC